MQSPMRFKENWRIDVAAQTSMLPIRMDEKACDTCAAIHVDEEIENQADILIDNPEPGRMGRVPETRERALTRQPQQQWPPAQRI
ncbi:hypothetical protein [Paraburkholderia sp. J69-1]|uniref:hypothetical protein n=1 Tax=Paraburkholderia sp. J69-1 TaxID=2805436 RepID=UPI002AB7047B|nr:hypothetical protein [Paraburkholderia sp. J69-1]